MPSTQDPLDTAANIAVLIDRDPVMAAKIKEYISEKRLLECLDLKSIPEDLAAVAMRTDRPSKRCSGSLLVRAFTFSTVGLACLYSYCEGAGLLHAAQ
jgi:hypothetical protein